VLVPTSEQMVCDCKANAAASAGDKDNSDGHLTIVIAFEPPVHGYLLGQFSVEFEFIDGESFEIWRSWPRCGEASLASDEDT